MFETELDRYESSLIPRVGVTSARDARHEMALHLEADYAARIESGFDEDFARRASLEAIGDLDAVAREEVPPAVSASITPTAAWGELGLVIAGALLYASWSVSGLNVGLPRLALILGGAAVLLAWGLPNARADRRPYGRAWALAAIVPLLVFGVYLVPMPSLPSGSVLIAAIVLAAVGSSVLGAVRRGAIWRLGLVMGSLIFAAQTLGVEFYLHRSGGHPGYPLDVTVGTWLAFTLPLLVLSAIGAGVASLAAHAVRRVRGVTR